MDENWVLRDTHPKYTSVLILSLSPQLFLKELDPSPSQRTNVLPFRINFYPRPVTCSWSSLSNFSQHSSISSPTTSYFNVHNIPSFIRTISLGDILFWSVQVNAKLSTTIFEYRLFHPIFT